MNKPSFLRRSGFVISLGVVGMTGLLLAFHLLRPTSYQIFQRVKVGDSFPSVVRRLGQPEESNKTPQGTDYLFVVTGNPEYPSSFGVPFPVHRIIRVRDEVVISTGPYENYYDPYKPGWALKTEGDLK